jgi:hypothetical protein
MRAELEREYVEYVTARLPALRRVAYQLTGDAHRGDDGVQQALTRLNTRWPRARGADNLNAIRTPCSSGSSSTRGGCAGPGLNSWPPCPSRRIRRCPAWRIESSCGPR